MKKILYFGLVAIVLLAGVESASAYGYGGSGGGSVGSLFSAPYTFSAPAPVIAPAPAPVTTGQVLGVSTFTFNANLRQGASSDDVKELQQRLTDEGVYTGPITGFFGPLTLKAVKDYQALKGLPQTGYVGPMTREALNGSSAPASNSNMTMSQFVEFLIQMGVISPDKAVAARQAVIK